MWRSVPQIEAALTLTKTSVRPKAGILTSRISAPGAASALTTASMVPDGEVLGMGDSLTRTELEEQTHYSSTAVLRCPHSDALSHRHLLRLLIDFAGARLVE